MILKHSKTGQLQMAWNLMWTNVVWRMYQTKQKHWLQALWTKIRVTESEKDLGVIINNDMKFKDQVASAAKKANKTLGMIKRNFKFVIKEAFEVLYGTLVRPQLEFAVHLWSPCQIDW